MTRMTTLLRRAGVSMLAAFIAVPALAQAGPKIRVDMNAPTGALSSIDTAGPNTKLFEHDATIPYGTLESMINGAVKNLTNQHGDVEDDVSVDYIDYHYKVNSTASFAFTQENQPTITVLSTTQNKVRVAVHTEARVKFKADASATTDDHFPVFPFPEYPDFDGTLKAEAVFKLDATADIAIWPTVAVENVSVVLANNKPDVKITGLQGDMTGFSLTVGSAIGFSPGGLLLGGPATFSLAALIGTNAGYDAAVTAIRNALAKGLEKAVQKANTQIASEIQKVVGPAVIAANQVKNAALNTTIPAVGASINQLQSQAGASLDVRTTAMGGGTRTTVTVRFDGVPRSGKVTGKLRFPKAKCRKTELGTAGQTLIVGFMEAANEDLAQGMSCSALLGSGLQTKTFLGGTPPGTSLANWKSASGQLVGKGTVKDVTTNTSSDGKSTQGYYECAFEITGLPKGVDAFTSTGALASRLEDYSFSDVRRWVLGLGQAWIVGGAGKCEGTGSGGGLTLDRPSAFIKEIEDCPECGPRLEQLRGEEVIRPDTDLRNPMRRGPKVRIERAPTIERGLGETDAKGRARGSEVLRRSRKGSAAKGEVGTDGLSPPVTNRRVLRGSMGGKALENQAEQQLER